eukprot:COSAG06_NODE_51060_length_314_cov_1.209302_1_plen_26_part_10
MITTRADVPSGHPPADAVPAAGAGAA